MVISDRASVIPVMVLAGIVAVSGCGTPQRDTPSAPTAPVTARSAPTTPSIPGTASPSATASTSTPSGEPSLAQVHLTGPAGTGPVEVTESGTSLQVRGIMMDEQNHPLVGVVGDFYLEGAPTNLVESYATKEDGSFSASFSTAEVPPEATLMLHYRGDSAHSPQSFVLRSGHPSAPHPSTGVSTTNTATAKPPAPASTSQAPGGNRPSAATQSSVAAQPPGAQNTGARTTGAQNTAPASTHAVKQSPTAPAATSR